MVFDVVIGRSKSHVKKYGKKGTVFIGKQYVKMGEVTSLSNPVYLDVASSHVVFVVGKRGGGKCLHGDTLITLDNGSQVKIKDLENIDQNVFTLDSNFKIKEGQKSHFYKRPVNKLLEVGLRSGKTIKLTPEHPLLTVKGWLPTEKLNIGARIATPRELEVFGDDSLEEDKVKLLAYLIAEGHLSNNFVLFSNADEKIITDFKKAVTSFDNELVVKEHSKPFCFRVVQNKKRRISYVKRDEEGKFLKGVEFDSKSSLRKWLDNLGMYGFLAVERKIPEEIFKLPKHQLSLFLNRLFSCDGTIYKKANQWFVSYCSSSNELISQVQHLLLRFGVVTRLRKRIIQNKFESNELYVYGENVNKFLQEIGFYGKKEERAKLALKEALKIVRNPNVDTIPKEIWNIYRPDSWAELGRKLNYSYPKAMRESQHYSPSRQKLLQIARADENDLLMKFACSDIFWDEIISLNVLEGEFEVYDITVPETHNFVANDIIVHNSYTMGVIAEGIAELEQEVRENLAVVLLDTMGVYWTMKYPNMQDSELLKEWGIEGKSLDVQIYTPTSFYEKYKAEGIPTDFAFAIRPIDVDPVDWCMSFGLEMNSAEGVLITKVVQELIVRGESFEIDDIIGVVNDDTESDHVVKNIVLNQFEKTKDWGIFSKEGTALKNLVKGGQVTVLDVSPYATMASGWAIKALVVGLISKKLFNQRMLARKTEEFSTIDSAMHYFTKSNEEKLEEPMVWLVLDECLPYSSFIRTDRGTMKIGKIINQFNLTKQLKVWGYDKEKKEFSFFKVTKVYKKGIRELIELKTETGKKIKCTPDHKILTKMGFKEAQKATDVGTPLQLDYSQEKKHIVARLIGHLYGDGWLSKGKRRQAGFSGKKDRNDLNKIKDDLKLIDFSSGEIYSRKTISRIKHISGKKVIVNGTTHSVSGSFCVFDFFSRKAVPVGNKTNQEVVVPKWLMKSSKQEKAEFLAALFGADGNAPSQSNKRGGDFNPIRLTFYKSETLRKEGEKYASQLKRLLSSLGIKVSRVLERKGNVRVDGSSSIRFDLTLAKSVVNTIKFLELVGYRYCTEKEEKGRNWLLYLKARQQKLKERQNLRRKALRLKKEKEWGKIKIARELKLPSYQVREWIYYNKGTKLPCSFPNFDKWVDKRSLNNVLYEKIISKNRIKSEPVFDISVDKVHNFVADGFVVHNCHELLPKEGKTSATDALVTILREGRQPGISLILASQQPGKVHTDVMTQSDTVISHRLTAKMDVEALGMLMQSYMRKGLDEELNVLPPVKGSAVVFDDQNEQLFPVQIRPRITWHGGSAPIAIKKKEKFMEGLKDL